MSLGNTSRIACICDSAPPGTGMTSVETAIARVHALARPVGETELVKLREARGRTLARTVHAPQPMPFFDNSAMDGFALSTKDLKPDCETPLPIGGESAAGETTVPKLAPGSCMRIFTGAPMPAGADAVVPLEQVRELCGVATFTGPPPEGANTRKAGSDIARNAVLVCAGTRLSARHAGLLAANGYPAVNVFRRPRVGVFSTGDELLDPGSYKLPGQLFDSNRVMLLTAFEEAGCETCDLGIIADDGDATRRFLRENSTRFDLLASSGSVSVGNRDFLKSAFIAAGGEIDSWKVAVKPGKPVMMGRIGRAIFLGLPGNPYAAWIGMQLFGRAMVAGLSGGTYACLQRYCAFAGSRFAHTRGREEYVPVRAELAGSRILLHRLGNGGSASMLAACHADGIAVIDAGIGNIETGDTIGFLPFSSEMFT